MKFLIVTLALLGVVAADVSHLKNNMYLPPHMAKLAHKHVEYVQQSQEIPQVEQTYSTGKIQIDNLNYGPAFAGEVKYHAEVPAAQTVTEEKKYHTGKIQIDNLNYGPAFAGEIQFQAGAPAVETVTEEKKYYTGLVNNKNGGATTTTTTTTSTEFSVPAPGSDTFTQQQAAYWTSVSQQQEEQGVKVPAKKYYTGLIQATGQNSGSASASTSTSTSTSTVVEQQAPEKQYYTGLVYHPGQDDAAVVEQSSQTAVIPGSDDFTNQQAAYWSQQSQAAQPEEPEKKYYTGLVYKPGQDDAAVVEQSSQTVVSQEAQPEPEKKYYTGLVYKPGQDDAAAVEESSQTAVIPGSDDFTNQQAAYWSQQQGSAPALGASAGIETKYAANGGYVY